MNDYNRYCCSDFAYLVNEERIFDCNDDPKENTWMIWTVRNPEDKMEPESDLYNYCRNCGTKVN